MTERTLSERHSAFLIAVGDLCAAASLASLHVELETMNGHRVRGIPSHLPNPDGKPEVDDTGYASEFHVGDTEVQLVDVLSCTLFAPLSATRGG